MLTESYREIHTSDLIRADVGNKDFHDDDRTKIHWEKFNMIGRFIDSITQCQDACREISNRDDFARENLGYVDHEDPKVRDLLLLNRNSWLLDPEVCVARLLCALRWLIMRPQSLGQRVEMDSKSKNDIGLEEDEPEDSARAAGIPRSYARDNSSHPRDGNGPLKKILFW